VAENLKCSVSILMPCYNAGKYIAEAIKSLLLQTHDNFVLHVVDDGSLDDTVKIVKGFAEHDSRIHFVEGGVNKGIIFRRNQLLNLCQTDLACWADADDVYKYERLERQVKFMQRSPKVGMCTSNYLQVEGDNCTHIEIPTGFLSHEHLLFYNSILNPGAMFRMSVIREHQITFDEQLSGASDYKFWAEMSRYTQFGRIDDYLVEYRIHPQQESAAQLKRQTQGHVETVHANLAYYNVFIEPDEIAELLVFPILSFGGKMSFEQHRRALKNIDFIYKQLSHLNKTKLRSVLIILSRSHCKRIGILSAWFFLSRFKCQGIAQSKYFGGQFAWSMFMTDFRRLFAK
jgi:glycosyltransferase involved in cell wall biosynthesis